jgi:hypothetical protein
VGFGGGVKGTLAALMAAWGRESEILSGPPDALFPTASGSGSVQLLALGAAFLAVAFFSGVDLAEAAFAGVALAAVALALVVLVAAAAFGLAAALVAFAAGAAAVFLVDALLVPLLIENPPIC